AARLFARATVSSSRRGGGSSVSRATGAVALVAGASARAALSTSAPSARQSTRVFHAATPASASTATIDVTRTKPPRIDDALPAAARGEGGGCVRPMLADVV